MSNYRAPAFNPTTKRVENADFVDNYFGKHEYGVKFDDGQVFRPHECDIWKAGEEIERLTPYVEAFRREEARADKLAQELDDVRSHVERLTAALSPFSDCVFNDNGDITVTTSNLVPEDYARAYFAMKSVSVTPQDTMSGPLEDTRNPNVLRQQRGW